MHTSNGEYRTSDTFLASYLLSEGFDILIVEYAESPNGFMQGTFVFDATPSNFKEFVSLYNRGEATCNIAQYEHVKTTLINRVKRGLP